MLCDLFTLRPFKKRMGVNHYGNTSMAVGISLQDLSFLFFIYVYMSKH